MYDGLVVLLSIGDFVRKKEKEAGPGYMGADIAC